MDLDFEAFKNRQILFSKDFVAILRLGPGVESCFFITLLQSLPFFFDLIIPCPGN